MTNKEKITITSALPYVNGVKHLGNIIGSLLPADIFHRLLDLMNIDNIYICGTDEHGTVTEVAALHEHLQPREYADKYYKIQKEIYEKWGFDFTNFGRTSSETHKEITKDVFLAIDKNGFIKEQTLTLPYCLTDKRFLPDRYIIGTCPKCGYDSARGDQCEKCSTVLDPTDLKNARCVICNESRIEFRSEKHLFLDLKKIQPKLKTWITKQKHWPINVRKLALGWIKEGLKPRCITRNLSWGVQVPKKGYEHLVFYVWFDAPLGYISITKEKLNDWEKYWTKPAKVYHFLGKDNIPFHTVFFPATLMASEKYTLPYYVAGYEYLNWEGQKFSTSRGIGLFSDEALTLFPADYWRFYLSRILPETKDSNFSWEDFQARINNELIANYGNLFYRVTSFIESSFSGMVPKPGDSGPEEKKLEKALNETLKNIETCVENVKLKDALNDIMHLAAETNAYFQHKQPWASNKKDAATTLYYSINLLDIISHLLKPYIPHAASQALKALGSSDRKWDDIHDFPIANNHKIKSVILFKKIEDDDITKAKKKKAQVPEKQLDLEIRTATIIDVRDHEQADKLYVIKIDLGNEQRQLVAGLRNVYTKEQLAGKKVLVLTNMKPAKLRGIESNGMILACDDGTIIKPEHDLENGTLMHEGSGEMTIEELQKHEFVVKNEHGKQYVYLDGKKLALQCIAVVPEKQVADGIRIR